MSLTDADLVRALAWVVGVLLTGGAAVVWWAARWVVGKIEGIGRMFTREMRAFDRRLTRVEAILKMPTPEPPRDDENYGGPERRSDD